MSLVAGQATQPLVNSYRRSVIPGPDAHTCKRRVTLVAERLANVGTDPDGTLAIAHGGQGKMADGNIVEFPPVE
jgi:hypothetical protein